jgi:4-azaleucine resistance transporter AzlC
VSNLGDVPIPKPDLDPELRPVVSASITLGAAVGVFGVVFGVGAVSAGGSVWQACVMSLLVFTGASQFTAVSVIDGGGTTGSALSSAMLLAARNGVYGLTMARHLDGSLARRLIAAQLTIDESTAMATAQRDRRSRSTAFWITGLSVYLFWNVGTLIGAVAGTSIDPEIYGLDAALPAGFVAMVAPHFYTPNGRAAGLLGGLICLVTIPFVPVGMSILCAGVAVLVGVRRG